MTFYTWLLTQNEREGDIGRLSQDLLDDPKRPIGNNIDFTTLSKHLERNRAHPCCFRALNDAYKEYKAFTTAS